MSVFNPEETEFDEPTHEERIRKLMEPVNPDDPPDILIYKAPTFMTQEEIDEICGEILTVSTDVDTRCYIIEDIDFLTRMGSEWSYCITFKEAGLSDV